MPELTALQDTDLPWAIYPLESQGFAELLNIERYIPQKTRDSYDAADFAGPDRSFPVTSQAQLDAAAHLIGHAADPDAVKRKAIAIAKRKGFTLPNAWQEDKGEDRMDVSTQSIATPETETSPEETSTVAIAAEERSEMPALHALYAPITRIDKKKWEVECTATSEALDTFKTIFSYDGSKGAFQRWIERVANVREMHEKKAVGKGVGVQFDDANQQIIVRTRVSRGAPDTWEKVLDGTLNGYSVGATNPVWGEIERDGKKYPYLLSYELAELSLVDSASNPDAQGLVICRADGLTDVVDITEPPEVEQPVPVSLSSSPVERAGARLSSDSRAALHEMRDKAMTLCGCEECQGMAKGDGDSDAGDRMTQEQAMEDLLSRLLSPLIQRQQAILTRFASIDIPEPTDLSSELIRSVISTEITSQVSTLQENMTALLERASTASSLSEVRSVLTEVKETVERIAAQPMPGGPILNGAGYPVDKHLANDPRSYAQQQQPDNAAVRAVLDRLQASGALNTVEAQTAAASLLIQPMGRMG